MKVNWMSFAVMAVAAAVLAQIHSDLGRPLGWGIYLVCGVLGGVWQRRWPVWLDK